MPSTRNWSILRNGNFTKLLILILLTYALGSKALESFTGVLP